MSYTSRLYLDVVGVISPLPGVRGLARDASPAAPPNTGWTWDLSAGIGSATPVEVLDDLKLLAGRYACEVVLADTGFGGASQAIAELGEQQGWRTITYPRVRRYEWPKLAGIQAEHRRDPLPFVWIDDSLTPTARRWAATVELPHLLLRPNRYHGVTPGTWARATEFMTAQAAPQ